VLQALLSILVCLRSSGMPVKFCDYLTHAPPLSSLPQLPPRVCPLRLRAWGALPPQSLL
jgi:hypothetical protein